ncbi:hypothetical protein D3C87_427560 [compost metagenome]
MIKKITLLLILFLFFSSFYAQSQKSIEKGVITLITNQKMKFKNLKFIEDQVVFTNLSTNSEYTYFLKAVRQIEDETKAIVYRKPEVLESKTAPNENKEISTLRAIENDTLFRPNYPEGIYKTKQDFINKKNRPNSVLIPKGLTGFEKTELESIEHNCFFYTTGDQKLKNVFAVSYKGHLYFQTSAILSNRNKTDRAQTTHFTNGFVRVIIGGENYFYTEADLTNLWAQALAYGAASPAISYNLARSMVYGKGIVWDFKNQEFNIFKNCDDYNDFIQDIYPPGIQSCVKQQPNVLDIRKTMEKIK